MPQIPPLYVIGAVDSKDAYDDARAQLEFAGYTVRTPDEFVGDEMPWDVALRMSIAAMLTKAGAVAVIDSETIEHTTLILINAATECNMPVRNVSEWTAHPLRQVV